MMKGSKLFEASSVSRCRRRTSEAPGWFLVSRRNLKCGPVWVFFDPAATGSSSVPEIPTDLLLESIFPLGQRQRAHDFTSPSAPSVHAMLPALLCCTKQRHRPGRRSFVEQPGAGLFRRGINSKARRGGNTGLLFFVGIIGAYRRRQAESGGDKQHGAAGR